MATSAVAVRRRKPSPSVRPLRAAADRVLHIGEKPACTVFLTRGMRALTRLAEALRPDALTDAATAETDYAVLVSALERPEALGELEREDPLAQARLRGLEARQQLLEAEGGPLRAAEAARLLRITRQAIDKRRRAGRLLGIRVGQRGYAYPSWQFSEDGVLPGLEEVLRELRHHGPWMQLAFLLSANIALDGQVPVEELRRGHVVAVRRAATLYGEQGAV